MEKKESKFKAFFEEGFSYFKEQNTEKLSEWFLASKKIIKEEAQRTIDEKNKIWNKLFYSPHAIMLLIDLVDGQIVDANRAAIDFYGYSYEKILSKKIDEINILSRTQVKAEMEAARLEKRNYFHFIHRLSNGERKQVNVYSAQIEKDERKLLFSQIYDVSTVSQQKKLIYKLKQAIEQSPVSVMITDIKGKIEYVNPYFEQITQYSLAEIKGKNPRILKSGYSPDSEYANLWETISSGKTWQGEFLDVKKNGIRYWERALITPLKDESGQIINFLGIKEVITKEKELVTKLQKSEQELKAVLSQRNQLFSIIGHDLRNPFNVILGYSQLLEAHFQNYPAKKIKKMLHFLNESTEKANNLLENLLTWGSVRTGKIMLLKTDIRVVDLLNKAIAAVSSQAISKKIKIELKVDNNVELRTDVDIVSTILRNLLTNALKYSQPNSMIYLKTQKKDEERFFICIEDFGVGISKEKLDKILEHKKNISSKGTQDERGTGLGLGLVFNFIDLLKSELSIESTENKGTKVSFSLELAKEKTG